MFERLKYYSRILFDPLFLTRHQLSTAIIKIVSPLLKNVNSCLDVGCGERPYEYLFVKDSYVGVDIQDSGRPLDMKQPDHFYDGRTLPFKDSSFDLVLSTQVLEHVQEPLALIAEMVRVCKDDGNIILSIPFVYPEHEIPFDYFRFTGFGICELLNKVGLRVVEIRKDTSWVEVFVTLVTVYIMNNLVIPLRGFSRIYALLICFPLQVLAFLFARFLPDDETLYLNIVVKARKI
jgi:SAM-dependent methyltransferase